MLQSFKLTLVSNHADSGDGNASYKVRMRRLRLNAYRPWRTYWIMVSFFFFFHVPTYCISDTFKDEIKLYGDKLIYTMLSTGKSGVDLAVLEVLPRLMAHGDAFIIIKK